MRKKTLTLLSIITIAAITACGSQKPIPEVSQDTVKPSAEEHAEKEQEKQEETVSQKPDQTESAPKTAGIDERIEAAGQKYLDFLDTQTQDLIAFGSTYKSVGSNAINAMGATDSMAMAESEEGLFDGIMDAAEEAPAYEAAQESTPIITPEDPTLFSRESYKNVDESGFILTSTQPFSTFGADVDTATYSNLRRKIFENIYYEKMNAEASDEYGYPQLYEYSGIDDNAVRLEEMINYFDYDYKAPENGEKFGVDIAYTQCPWNDDTDLLRIGIKTEDEKPANGSNIVFLIDTSGSMFDFDKLPLVQKSFDILQQQLGENDRVSIVTYAGNEEVVAEGLSGSEHEKIKEAVDSLEAWGSTNGEGGIKKAYEIAEKYFIEGGNNRVILATDGDLNVGVTSEAGLVELIEKEKQTGVFLSCLGFGTGNYQDDKMEALADKGNGNYAYIDCENEAQKVLKKELWSNIYTVAKDTKFQVEFNPQTVKGYRLIGYENRKMAAEDFADDKKDGGEIGAGQCVTVLYEVVTSDSAYEIPTVTSRYAGKNENTEETSPGNELLAVNIRYKEPDEDESILKTYPVTKDMKKDKMDDDTSWTAGVAQFGMLIRDSSYKGTSDYTGIYDRLSQNPKVSEDDFMAEFLYMVKKSGKDRANDTEETTDTADAGHGLIYNIPFTAMYHKEPSDTKNTEVSTYMIWSAADLDDTQTDRAIESDVIQDEGFFDKHVLMHAVVPAVVGTRQYNIKEISMGENLEMHVDTIIPADSSDEVSTWHLLAIITKTDLPEQISKTDNFELIIDDIIEYSEDISPEIFEYQDIYGIEEDKETEDVEEN